MKRITLSVIGLLVVTTVFAQSGRGYDANYRLLSSGSRIADKNFYLLTVLRRSAAVKALLAADDALAEILHQRAELIRLHAGDEVRVPEDLLAAFRWTSGDSATVDLALLRCYERRPAVFDALVNRDLRPSGCYQRWVSDNSRGMLLRAWGLVVSGTNYIIDQYGLGKKLRYPAIDSASYDVHGEYYRDLLKEVFGLLAERTDSMRFFFEPSLDVAMELMRANDRDEPGRFEPLTTGENAKAVAKVRVIGWSRYRYSAILVPGEGPELARVAFDPIGRIRCDLAAARWRQGYAPFIIVSGGYCHPFHTPYCEAWEMKKYLLHDCGIPESAVIMEPQARHTTTNFRNATRLMIRYGMPVEKPALCVSTKDQTDYIEDAGFDRRNLYELGYLPYRGKKRVDSHSIEFYPVMDCLQMDPGDPLDP